MHLREVAFQACRQNCKWLNKKFPSISFGEYVKNMEIWLLMGGTLPGNLILTRPVAVISKLEGECGLI